MDKKGNRKVRLTPASHTKVCERQARSVVDMLPIGKRELMHELSRILPSRVLDERNWR